MSRQFKIKWYVTKEAKFRAPIERCNVITIPNPSTDTGVDAKLALNKFMRVFGGLNKNTVVEIQEFEIAEDGSEKLVGEPITPSDDTAIIPAGK